ncbi:hypothetical protein EIP91_003088 [Steccherinum ochraceum]|uniref:Uncharacterized protein n=1 Tax=Steccherinum ochraceum TaxID=92696 RepID=A0A4R0RRN0_9APHY|nr:hypothetical protein EIP91_003088 [Steccherinum ochraceum]
MYTLKTPSFLKPSSRPTSPSPTPARPDSAAPPTAERSSRASVLSFSSFKRTASPLTRPASSTSLAAAATPLIQDGSYMESLNLKLSEAVSKALGQPSGPGVPSEVLNGRRPIPAGRGRALADLIVSEVQAVRENPYLHRAVLRTLHRPLSVLVNNLSNNLMPLLASPAFLTPTVPSPQAPNPNPTQLHAIGLATFAGELVEMYDAVPLYIEGDMRADGLRVIRDSLVSIVKRVVEPLVTGIKNDLVPYLDALENPNATPYVPITGTTTKATPASKAPVHHPSIMYMQNVMPTYARALARYITSPTAEAALASLLINLVWRGLVALSNRPAPLASPNTSPSMPTAALKKDGKTPPTTPPASKFTLRLPPSRPPSPPATTINKATTASDARALYDLLSSLPRPMGDGEQKRLAQEVVDEAIEALAAMAALLEATQTHGHIAANMKNQVFKSFGGSPVIDLEHDLEVLTADIPTLIALPLILRTYFPPSPSGNPQGRSVSAMLGLTEAAYRTGCLSGFGRADECTVAVGQHVLSVLRDEVRTCRLDENAAREAAVVLKWLEREVALVATGDH